MSSKPSAILLESTDRLPLLIASFNSDTRLVSISPVLLANPAPNARSCVEMVERLTGSVAAALAVAGAEAVGAEVCVCEVCVV